MTRNEANQEILKILNKCLDKKYDLRFNQLLTILNQDKDLFNQEPTVTLEYIIYKLRLLGWNLDE